jgi:hypothetical protein
MILNRANYEDIEVNFKKGEITVGYGTYHFSATILMRLAVCARTSGQGA